LAGSARVHQVRHAGPRDRWPRFVGGCRAARARIQDAATDFDIPLLIKDVMIAPEPVDGRPPGTLIYNDCSHFGAFGDVVMVNGKQQPRSDVANRKVQIPCAARP
jgi:hypothetical protein